ncbi:MAG: hypothetical protein JW904_09195 [Spirochaetales bacterium]|nr:hypothetical protein [Spirochaetales bacterium]
MKTFRRLLLLCGMLLFLTTVIVAEKNNSPASGLISVSVSNETSLDLIGVYYYSDGGERWSNNLTESSRIKPHEAVMVQIPSGKHTLVALYKHEGKTFQIRKNGEFREGKEYFWPIAEEQEPSFPLNIDYYPYDYYDPYSYYDYYDPYGYYYDYYDPYGYYDDYDPYGYYDDYDPYGYYYSPYGYY